MWAHVCVHVCELVQCTQVPWCGGQRQFQVFVLTGHLVCCICQSSWLLGFQGVSCLHSHLPIGCWNFWCMCCNLSLVFVRSSHVIILFVPFAIGIFILRHCILKVWKLIFNFTGAYNEELAVSLCRYSGLGFWRMLALWWCWRLKVGLDAFHIKR